jgi:hypothetical protein
MVAGLAGAEHHVGAQGLHLFYLNAVQVAVNASRNRREADIP